MKKELIRSDLGDGRMNTFSSIKKYMHFREVYYCGVLCKLMADEKRCSRFFLSQKIGGPGRSLRPDKSMSDYSELSKDRRDVSSS